MPISTSEATAAFRAADPVAPGAYDDAATGPEATATLRRILATPVGKPRRPRPRAITIGAAVTTAAAVATAVAVGTAGGTGPAPTKSYPPVSNAAYSVRNNPDGSVTVTVHNWFFNLADLTTELNKRGVPVLPPPAEPGRHHCYYAGTSPVWSDKDAGQALGALGGFTHNTFTARPKDFPHGYWVRLDNFGGKRIDGFRPGFGMEVLKSNTRPKVKCR